MHSRWKIIAILAVTQIMAWGGMYYAFAVLAPRMVSDMGWPVQWVFGAFSWALVVAGLFSTHAGKLLDRLGGRTVMSTGSLLCGAGLATLGLAHSLTGFFVGWTILGLAMPLTLYEAAFATINRQIECESRRAISTLTLFAGFASSIFWPLTMLVESKLGWRNTYLVYGMLQVLICLPLHLALGAHRTRVVASAEKGARNFTLAEACRHPAFWKLAAAFATNSFVFSAMSVHLILMFEHLGHSTAYAVAIAALIGPMQVVGRLGEMTLARNLAPQFVGKLAFAALPGATLALVAYGSHQLAVAAFCAVYGLSNGILTIVRGTLPQALFGKENYGAISGALSSPALIARAIAPLAVALFGAGAHATNTVLLVFLGFFTVSAAFFYSAVKPDKTMQVGTETT